MIVTKSRTMLDLPYDRAHASCTLHTQKLEKELLLQQQQQRPRQPSRRVARRRQQQQQQRRAPWLEFFVFSG